MTRLRLSLIFLLGLAACATAPSEDPARAAANDSLEALWLVSMPLGAYSQCLDVDGSRLKATFSLRFRFDKGEPRLDLFTVELKDAPAPLQRKSADCVVKIRAIPSSRYAIDLGDMREPFEAALRRATQHGIVNSDTFPKSMFLRMGQSTLSSSGAVFPRLDLTVSDSAGRVATKFSGKLHVSPGD